MKKIKFGFGLIWTIVISLQSQTTTIQVVSDYNQWGWEAVVMKNDLITVATVPAIGARVMQYDLGDHPSIFVNPAMLNTTRTPGNYSSWGQWPNFGGFKNWPSPQNWSVPPPVLDFGAYTYEVEFQTPDSAAIFVSSAREQWITPNLRFERKTTIFSGTSRVRMEQTLFNEGSKAVERGIWDITQSLTHHENQTDYENFWVYFPFKENSVFGSNHVKWSASSKAWKGEIAPGIYGVQFLPEDKKIYADSPEGWVVYADRRDGFIYAKTFEIQQDANYPDGGACVEAWIAANPPYVEVEVLGPVVQIPANGGKIDFTIDWWAAKVRTPVLDVNTVGAVARNMAYEGTTTTLSGIYGVFYSGTARVVFLGEDGGILSEGQNHAVTPLTEFELQESIEIPNGAESVEIRIFDEKGNPAGILERAEVGQITGITEIHSVSPSDFKLDQNYPNPFNGFTILSFYIPVSSRGSLKIFDIRGNEVATLKTGVWESGKHRLEWNPAATASGVYVAKLVAGNERKTLKMLYLR